MPSLKIVGGKAADPNGWPSMALIVFRYKFYVKYSENYYIASVSYICGGTLIDRNTVLTAGHCYIDTVDYDYQTYKVVPNNFYPTIASMYTIYLGIHNKSEAVSGAKLTNGISVPVSEFIRVS